MQSLVTRRSLFSFLPHGLVLGVLAALPVACGGGGGSSVTPDVKASDIAGVWNVTTKVAGSTGTVCTAVNGDQTSYQWTIAGSGSPVTIVETGPFGQVTFTLNLVGNRVKGTFNDSGDLRTFDFGISNGVLSGTVSTAETQTVLGVTSTLCTIAEAFDAVKATGGGGGGSSNFNGTWNLTGSTASVTGSQCGSTVGEPIDPATLTIVINGTTATVTETGQAPFTLNVVNGRLQGTQTESQLGFDITAVIDLGQPSTNTLSGTQTATIRLAGVVVCTQVDNLQATRQ